MENIACCEKESQEIANQKYIHQTLSHNTSYTRKHKRKKLLHWQEDGDLKARIDEIEEMLINNHIWKQRP